MHYSKHAVVNTLMGGLALRLTDLPILSRTLLPVILIGFVDVDHWLFHVFKERTLSFKKLRKLVIEDWEARKLRFYPFHTIEFGLVFTLVVTSTAMSWLWAFGYWVHLLSDAYHNYRLRGNVSSWFPTWIGTLQGLRMLRARRSAGKQTKSLRTQTS
ncbi:hypothetical protein IH980_05830 [Patescibacteria group bacterium]|nr:hypothetical protein [Patescibacteria group bacterium]